MKMHLMLLSRNTEDLITLLPTVRGYILWINLSFVFPCTCTCMKQNCQDRLWTRTKTNNFTNHRTCKHWETNCHVTFCPCCGHFCSRRIFGSKLSLYCFILGKEVLPWPVCLKSWAFDVDKMIVIHVAFKHKQMSDYYFIFLQTTFTFDVRRKYFKESLDRSLHVNYNVVK